MSPYVQISKLSKSFDNPLFQNVNLSATGPTKIGLIGDNGSGKSTFLKMLAGLDPVTDGQIIWSPDAQVGYLEQEITNDLYQVSGGQQKIIRLTQLFYSHYNVVLLDEPDNHLDLDHKYWFEQLVQDFPGIAIIISHDRHFLSRAVDTIWNLHEAEIKSYPFAYEQFKSVYEQELGSRQHLWETQEKERQRLAELVKLFRLRAMNNSKLSGRYSSMVKRYEKFVQQMVEKPPQESKLKLTTTIGKQHHRKTALHLKDISKSYSDQPVLNQLNLHVFCGEKIAINAPNGAGKSTLLNIIAGRIPLDSGEVKLGVGLHLGYYIQDHAEALDDSTSLIEEIRKSARFNEYQAMAFLKKFFFSEQQAKSPTKYLSGGQKSRLQLAKFLATNPEVLVLDEPTNHLDLKTVLALENFLRDYPGALVLVSHDQELVSQTVDTTYTLEQGKLVKQ